MEFQQFQFLNEIETQRESESTSERETIFEKASNYVVEPIIESEKEAVSDDQVIKYKQAEYVIGKKCKVFIEEQAVQNNVSQILFAKNLLVKEQIEKEKKHLNDLKLEREMLNIQESGSCADVLHLQEFLSKADEIKQTLEEQSTALLSEAEDININLKKLLNRNQTFEENIKTKILNIQRLQKAIEDETNLKRDDDDSVKKENLRLKLVAADLKKKLEVSKVRLKEEQKQKEINCKLKEQKEILHNKLKQTKESLTQFQNQAHQEMVDRNFIVNSLQQSWETKKQRTVSLNDEIAETIKTTEATKQNIQKLEESIDKERLLLGDVEGKIVEMKKHIQEMETKLDREQHKSIEDIKEKITSAEANLTKLIDEHNEKVKEEEHLHQNYASKLAEKNKLTIEKEAIVKESQMALIKNQFLDEKIAALEIKIVEIKEKMNTIADEPDVVKISKQKTYLDTCNTYLKENVTIFEKNKIETEKSVNLLIKQNNSIKNKIEECEKQLQEIRNSSSNRGILKKKNQPNKQTTCPKTVQFLNMSSDDSSVITDQQQSTVTFDKLYEEFVKTEKHKIKKLNF